MTRPVSRRGRRMADPTTPTEWADAVDSAALMLALRDCVLYGLIDGLDADDVDTERCDEILRRGRTRGHHPRPPAVVLAELLAAP